MVEINAYKERYEQRNAVDDGLVHLGRVALFIANEARVSQFLSILIQDKEIYKNDTKDIN